MTRGGKRESAGRKLGVPNKVTAETAEKIKASAEHLRATGNHKELGRFAS